MRCHPVVRDSELDRKGSRSFPHGRRKGIGSEEAQAWLHKRWRFQKSREPRRKTAESCDLASFKLPSHPLCFDSYQICSPLASGMVYFPPLCLHTDCIPWCIYPSSTSPPLCFDSHKICTPLGSPVIYFPPHSLHANQDPLADTCNHQQLEFR